MIVIVVSTYLGICLLLFFFQRSLLYHPTRVPKERQSTLRAFEVEGATLQVSVRPRSFDEAVLYFGGNGEDVSASLDRFAHGFPRHAIYMVHYRGYGGSSGSPSQDALFADGQAMFDQVHQEHEHVIVVGRSLGSGIAIHVASKKPVSRLILVTPYDSILNVAKGQFPVFPVGLMLHDKFESWREAPLVTAPTLVVIAELDEIIAPKRSQALMKHFSPGVAELVELKGVGHNSIATNPEYMRAVTKKD
jgi:pimeloyl-ACP methyl ester carboxylesterase